MDEDYVVYEVEDMETGHIELVVARNVVDAASKVTKAHGPKLRGYKRIGYIDRMPIEPVAA